MHLIAKGEPAIILGKGAGIIMGIITLFSPDMQPQVQPASHNADQNEITQPDLSHPVKLKGCCAAEIRRRPGPDAKSDQQK